MKRYFLLLGVIFGFTNLQGQDQPELIERFSDPTQFVNSFGLNGNILFSDPDGTYFEPEGFKLRYDANLARGPLRLNMSLGLSNLYFNPSVSHSFTDFRLALGYSFDLPFNKFDRLNLDLQYQIPLVLGDYIGNDNGLAMQLRSRVKLSNRLSYYPGLMVNIGHTRYTYFEPYTYVDPQTGDSSTHYSQDYSAVRNYSLGMSNRLVYRFKLPFYLQTDVNYLWTNVSDLGEALSPQESGAYSDLRLSLSFHYVYRKLDFGLRTDWQTLLLEDQILNYRRERYTAPSFGLSIRYAFE